MSDNSAIQWTDASWNPVVGCTRVSAGCDNCYAVRMSHRLESMGQEAYRGLTVLNARGDRHFNGIVRLRPEKLDEPLHWRKPRTVFVNSMSDLFHKEVPFEFIDKVFAVMALAPQHTYQILTKRPERMAEYLNSETGFEDRKSVVLHMMQRVRGVADYRGTGWPLPNVWLGTSCEDQATADERIPHLLKCPAAVRFLSLEPLLGPIEFATVPGFNRCGSAGREILDRFWVIVGGESGAGARPCNVAWVRDIVRQCRDAGVPVFVKQLGRSICGAMSPDTEQKLGCPVFNGDWQTKVRDPKGGDIAEWPEDLRVREFPTTGG